MGRDAGLVRPRGCLGELTAYVALKQDLETMGQGKVGTAWHRDRVEQLAILIRSLTRRGLLN
jgi:hypothetical protein